MRGQAVRELHPRLAAPGEDVHRRRTAIAEAAPRLGRRLKPRERRAGCFQLATLERRPCHDRRPDTELTHRAVALADGERGSADLVAHASAETASRELAHARYQKGL